MFDDSLKEVSANVLVVQQIVLDQILNVTVALEALPEDLDDAGGVQLSIFNLNSNVSSLVVDGDDPNIPPSWLFLTFGVVSSKPFFTVSHQGAIGNFFHCIFGHLLIHDQGNAVVRLAWVMLLDIVSNSAFKEGFKIGILSLRQLLAAPRPKLKCRGVSF